MIDFNKLSTLTLTSLILAITFSVLAIAGIFYSMYRKGSFKNSLARFACLLIVPFVAFSMWALAILSITKTFANEEALAIILSMAIGAALVTILFFVSKSIETLQAKKANEDELESASKEELAKELVEIENDLNNLKGIIDEVIEEPKEKANDEKKIVVVKVEAKEEPKEAEEVKEEAEESKEETEESPAEEVKEEVKEEPAEEVKAETEEVKEEAEEVKEEAEEAKQEVAEEAKEEEKEEEVKAEEVKEVNEESDFIKSLNEILGQLESDDE